MANHSVVVDLGIYALGFGTIKISNVKSQIITEYLEIKRRERAEYTRRIFNFIFVAIKIQFLYSYGGTNI